METPKVVERLIETQNSFDSKGYSECFTESAIVHDEGKIHNGRVEIHKWIQEANEKYKSQMHFIQYEETGSSAVLTSEITGTFPQSPIVLKYHMELKDGLIDSLKVTE